MLTLLRGWIGLVAAMALVSVIQSFLDQQFLKDRIYNLQPSEGSVEEFIFHICMSCAMCSPTQPQSLCLEHLVSGHY